MVGVGVDLHIFINLVPRPSFDFAHGGPGMQKYVTLGQCGCVHGEASFHHDIVLECLWPSSSLVQVFE